MVNKCKVKEINDSRKIKDLAQIILRMVSIKVVLIYNINNKQDLSHRDSITRWEFPIYLEINNNNLYMDSITNNKYKEIYILITLK